MIRRSATIITTAIAAVVFTGCSTDPVSAPERSRALAPHGPSATIENLTSAPILLDQRTEDSNFEIGGAAITQPVLVGDDFSVPVTWKISHVAVSGTLSTPTLTFAIRKDNATAPGERIASFTLAPSKVDPNPSTSEEYPVNDYLFTLPQALTLTPGNYWLVLRTFEYNAATNVGTGVFKWQFHFPSTGSFALTTFTADTAEWSGAVTKAFPDAAFVLFGEPVRVVVFDGFASPVKNGGALNSAKAGQTIPLKWRLTDASGQPITNLTTATIVAKDLACAAGSTVDQIAESAAGASGLQNLGDGYYQLNWKTPSSYKGSCKTVTLTLGDGSTHTTLFQFTK